MNSKSPINNLESLTHKLILTFENDCKTKKVCKLDSLVPPNKDFVLRYSNEEI